MPKIRGIDYQQLEDSLNKVGINTDTNEAILTIVPTADFTATGTTTANAATTITGSGTVFLTELGVGDRIALSSASTTFGTVTAIASNTSLTVDTALGNGTSQTISVKKGLIRADSTTSTGGIFGLTDQGYLRVGSTSPITVGQVELITANLNQTTVGGSAQAIGVSNTLNTNSASGSTQSGIRSLIVRTITTNTTDTVGAYSIIANMQFNVPTTFTLTGPTNANLAANYRAGALTIPGGGAFSGNLAKFYAVADPTAMSGTKIAFYSAGISGATNNAILADNTAFSGSFVINTSSTLDSLMAGNLRLERAAQRDALAVRYNASSVKVGFYTNSTSSYSFLGENLTDSGSAGIFNYDLTAFAWAITSNGGSALGIYTAPSNTAGTTAFNFTTGSPAVRIDGTANVGIGLGGGSPGNRLDINGPDAAEGAIRLSGFRTSASNVSNIYLRAARGTAASPSVVVNGDTSSNIYFQPYHGSGYATSAWIGMVVDGVPGGINVPTGLEFSTGNNSTSTERMRIDSSGRLLINKIASTSGLNGPLEIKNFTSAASFCGILSDAGGRLLRLATSDYVDSSNTGSVLSFTMATGTGNTNASMQVFTAGTSVSAGTLLQIQPSGGSVAIGPSAPGTGVTLEVSTTGVSTTTMYRLTGQSNNSSVDCAQIVFNNSSFGIMGRIRSINHSVTDGQFIFETRKSGAAGSEVFNTNHLFLDGTGKVGIGISPNFPLDIFYQQNGGVVARFISTAVGGTNADTAIDLCGANVGNVTYGRIGLNINSGSGGTETGGLYFSTINSGSLSAKLSLTAAGAILPTNIHNNDGVGGAASQAIASGTYTPTNIGVGTNTNVSASSAFAAQWLRVGNCVTVSGSCNIQTTTGGLSSTLTISLPTSVATLSLTQLVGWMSGQQAGTSGTVVGDATNKGAQLSWTAASTTNTSYYFQFTYQIN